MENERFTNRPVCIVNRSHSNRQCNKTEQRVLKRERKIEMKSSIFIYERNTQKQKVSTPIWFDARVKI